jgi:hypothetical protein
MSEIDELLTAVQNFRELIQHHKTHHEEEDALRAELEQAKQITRDQIEQDERRNGNEINNLRAELSNVKNAAIEQSEIVQRDWLSPMEATGLRAELARVTAERDALIEQIARLGNDPHSR